MGTLTIRNLEETVKSRLRLRAAAANRSMAEEARQILRSALETPAAAPTDLGSRIRSRFAGHGDVQLAPTPREPAPRNPGTQRNLTGSPASTRGR